MAFDPIARGLAASAAAAAAAATTKAGEASASATAAADSATTATTKAGEASASQAAAAGSATDAAASAVAAQAAAELSSKIRPVSVPNDDPDAWVSTATSYAPDGLVTGGSNLLLVTSSYGRALRTKLLTVGPRAVFRVEQGKRYTCHFTLARSADDPGENRVYRQIAQFDADGVWLGDLTVELSALTVASGLVVTEAEFGLPGSGAALDLDSRAVEVRPYVAGHSGHTVAFDILAFGLPVEVSQTAIDSHATATSAAAIATGAADWVLSDAYQAMDRDDVAIAPAAILDFAHWRAARPLANDAEVSTAADLSAIVAVDPADLLSAAAQNSTVTNAAGLPEIITAARRDFDPRALMSEAEVTNYLKNPLAYSAGVAGSPGTMPTNWSTSLGTGLSRQITGTGVVGDLKYIDIRIYGTSTGAISYSSILFGLKNSAVAAQGETWTASMRASITGDYANTEEAWHGIRPWIVEGNATPAKIGEAVGDPLDGAFATRSVSRTMASASTAYVWCGLYFAVSADASVDFTLRITEPQLEKSSVAHRPVPPNTASLAATTKKADLNTLASVLQSILGRDEWTIAIRATPLDATPDSACRILGFDAAAGGAGILLNTDGSIEWDNGSAALAVTPGSSIADGFGMVASWDGTTRRICVNGGSVAADASNPGPMDNLGLGCGSDATDGVFEGWIFEVVVWPKALSNAAMIAQAVASFVATVPAEIVALRTTPSRLQRTNIELWSGGQYQLPEGWVTLKLGPFLDLAWWNPERECWQVSKKPIGGVVPTFWCDGESWRVVNTVDCCIHAAVLAGGSGYSSATPPTITVTNSPKSGRVAPQLRTTVGGALTVSIVSGGVYDYPPVLKFDYGLQTPPYREAQVSLDPDPTTGALTTVRYDGNDLFWSLGKTVGYTGAGLDVAQLSWEIVRDPRDTQTTDAVLSVAAAGSGEVTNVEVTDFGSALGNVDAAKAFTITHNGGSGADFRLINNYYMIGYTIVDAGDYRNASNDPYSSSTDGLYGMLLAMSDGDDEQSRPLCQPGVVTITSGALTGINHVGIGPGFQHPPKLIVIPPANATVVRNAVVTCTVGVGGDYFTIEHRS